MIQLTDRMRCANSAALIFDQAMGKKRVSSDHQAQHKVPVTAIEKMQAGFALDALVAERVMGWKDVQRQESRSWAKKKDKAGRWRRVAVPNFSGEPTMAYAIDERMKELGLAEKYSKELGKMTHAKNVPVEWATPYQRCRAALKTLRSNVKRS